MTAAPVKRDILFLHCQDGHDWKFVGCKPCGCDGGGCSLPVHECTRCGESDYGENDEARAIVKECDREARDAEEVLG